MRRHYSNYFKGVDHFKDFRMKLVSVATVEEVNGLLDARFNVSFADVQKAAVPCLRHRLLLNFEGEAENLSTDAVIEDMLKQTPTVTEKAA